MPIWRGQAIERAGLCPPCKSGYCHQHFSPYLTPSGAYALCTCERCEATHEMSDEEGLEP